MRFFSPLRIVLVAVVAAVVAGGACAFTAANTVPATNAGSGSGTVSGYTVSTPATAPGATYAAPSTASVLLAALHPSQTGTLPRSVTNTVAVGRSRFTGAALEILGAMLILGGPWAVGTGQFRRRRRQIWSTERRIAHRYGRDMFDVSDLPAPPNTAVTPVPDLESLTGIARQAERPILRHVNENVTVFVVDDPPRLYRFELTKLPEPAEPAPSSRTGSAPGNPAPSSPAPPLPRRVPTVVGFVVALTLVVAVSAATFTAGNVVPASYAGRSSFARTLTQIAPALCAGVNPANLVVATTSSNSGTSQNDLILGRNAAGSQTLSGGNGNDCIVAGGGAATTNTLQGGAGSGDVCIGSPEP
jgi:hypothetical protein